MYEEGSRVRWKWGEGYGHGTIQSVFTRKTVRKIDGAEVIRLGSKDDPAYYIDSDQGNNVLKLHSEIEQSE